MQEALSKNVFASYPVGSVLKDRSGHDAVVMPSLCQPLIVDSMSCSTSSLDETLY